MVLREGRDRPGSSGRARLPQAVARTAAGGGPSGCDSAPTGDAPSARASHTFLLSILTTALGNEHSYPHRVDDKKVV